ncbi:MAG: hypothetical protein ACLUUG_07790 [Lachnospiraceae bacterium]
MWILLALAQDRKKLVYRGATVTAQVIKPDIAIALKVTADDTLR